MMPYEGTPYALMESRGRNIGDYTVISDTLFGIAQSKSSGEIVACLTINGITYATTLEDMAEIVVMIADGLSEFHANKPAPK